MKLKTFLLLMLILPVSVLLAGCFRDNNDDNKPSDENGEKPTLLDAPHELSLFHTSLLWESTSSGSYYRIYMQAPGETQLTPLAPLTDTQNATRQFPLLPISDKLEDGKFLFAVRALATNWQISLGYTDSALGYPLEITIQTRQIPAPVMTSRLHGPGSSIVRIDFEPEPTFPASFTLEFARKRPGDTQFGQSHSTTMHNMSSWIAMDLFASPDELGAFEYRVRRIGPAMYRQDANTLILWNKDSDFSYITINVMEQVAPQPDGFQSTGSVVSWNDNNISVFIEYKLPGDTEFRVTFRGATTTNFDLATIFVDGGSIWGIATEITINAIHWGHSFNNNTFTFYTPWKYVVR